MNQLPDHQPKFSLTRMTVPDDGGSRSSDYPFQCGYGSGKISIAGGKVRHLAPSASSMGETVWTSVAPLAATTGTRAYLKISRASASDAPTYSLEVSSADEAIIETTGTGTGEYTSVSRVLLAQVVGDSFEQYIVGNLLLTMWVINGFAAYRAETATF